MNENSGNTGDKEGQNFLKQLCETPGISGFEQKLGDKVQKKFEPLVDETRRDVMGNIIMLKKGSAKDSPSLMLAAHMDEIGLVVTKIEERGFLRFSRIGGVDPRNILAKEVIVHGKEDIKGVIGVKPPHLISADERTKAIEMDKMYIDVAMDEDEVKEKVNVGDPIVFRREMYDLAGDRIAAKAMDDRAGVAGLYEAAKVLQKIRHNSDVYFVATVQEEVGLRGAVTSTFDIMPDAGIAVDVGMAKTPGLPSHIGTKMGKGPVITQGANIHPHMYSKLKCVCDDHRIPYQDTVAPAASGTDAWAMQVTQSGVPTALVSIPLRYMHTTVETLSWSDIENSGALLAHFASAMNRDFVEGFYDTR